jgi:hypothetical protein
MKYIARSLAFVVCFTSAAFAQDHYRTKGQGEVPCAKFGEHYRESPQFFEDTFFAWALGYMSAINWMMTPGSYHDINAKDTKDMKAQLRQYCNAHPLANYKEGVLELWQSLPIVKPAAETSGN